MSLINRETPSRCVCSAPPHHVTTLRFRSLLSVSDPQRETQDGELEMMQKDSRKHAYLAHIRSNKIKSALSVST